METGTENRGTEALDTLADAPAGSRSMMLRGQRGTTFLPLTLTRPVRRERAAELLEQTAGRVPALHAPVTGERRRFRQTRPA